MLDDKGLLNPPLDKGRGDSWLDDSWLRGDSWLVLLDTALGRGDNLLPGDSLLPGDNLLLDDRGDSLLLLDKPLLLCNVGKFSGEEEGSTNIFRDGSGGDKLGRLAKLDNLAGVEGDDTGLGVELNILLLGKTPERKLLAELFSPSGTNTDFLPDDILL